MKYLAGNLLRFRPNFFVCARQVRNEGNPLSHASVLATDPPELRTWVADENGGRKKYNSITQRGAQEIFNGRPTQKKKMFLPPPGSSSQKIFCVTKRVHSKNPLMEGTFFFFRSKKWNNTTDSLGIRWNFLGRKIGFWRPTKKNPSGPTEFHWKLKWHFLEKI